MTFWLATFKDIEEGYSLLQCLLIPPLFGPPTKNSSGAIKRRPRALAFFTPSSFPPFNCVYLDPNSGLANFPSLYFLWPFFSYLNVSFFDGFPGMASFFRVSWYQKYYSPSLLLCAESFWYFFFVRTSLQTMLTPLSLSNSPFFISRGRPLDANDTWSPS